MNNWSKTFVIFLLSCIGVGGFIFNAYYISVIYNTCVESVFPLFNVELQPISTNLCLVLLLIIMMIREFFGLQSKESKIEINFNNSNESLIDEVSNYATIVLSKIITRIMYILVLLLLTTILI